MYTIRLIEEVWERDRCAGCATCIAACSKHVLVRGEEHPTRRVIEQAIGLSRFPMDTCSFCQHFCEAVCPRLEHGARKASMALVAAKASGVLGGGEPNDVVRNMLIAARASGLIDGALLADTSVTGTTRARVALTPGDIAESTAFQAVWTPVLTALNEAVFGLGLRKLAIVGTPCAAEGVRRLLDSPLERLAPYKQAIRLNIAVFCTGVYSQAALTDILVNGMGVTPEEVRRVTSSPRRGTLRAELWSGAVREMDLSQVERYTRKGCARCDDYLGESADLAVGTVGAPEGYSTVIVRSDIGLAAVQNATTMKLLETSDVVDEVALEQARAHKDRRERAQAFDELQVLMMNALRDPRKRAEVKQKFDMMYGGAGRVTGRKEDYRYAGCGDCSGC